MKFLKNNKYQVAFKLVHIFFSLAEKFGMKTLSFNFSFVYTIKIMTHIESNSCDWSILTDIFK